MNKRALAVLVMVTLLGTGGTLVSAKAESGPGMASSSPVVQSAPTAPSDPSGEFMGRWHHKPSLEAIQKKLGLNDEQKNQMRALHVGFKDRTRKARTELMALKDEKKTMLLSGKIDQQKLAQIDDQVVKLVSEVLKEKLKLRRDRLALLTPEQVGKIADWRAEKAFRSKWRKMHGGRGHGEFGHGGGLGG